MNKNTQSTPISIEKKHNDNVKPILAYFSFTTKYMIKKKSTIFIPILSFIFVLIFSMMPIFFLSSSDSLQTITMFTSIFIFTTLLISISTTSLFATIKALNLFKDISREGMEILIVSKPIKRSQIIFVRFVYFLFLGIALSLVNYFALLLGLLISMSVFPPNFPLFNHITIYFFSMMMAYVFFGSISILFSLRFSTKLVSSLSMGILGVGNILSSTIPQMIPIVEKGFEYKLSAIQNESQDSDNFYLRYELDDNGNLVIYIEDILTPITPEQLKIITKAYNEKDDLSWIINLNNFLNPVAGITKISSVKPNFFMNSSGYGPNFSDFNISLEEGQINNNLINGFNHFMDLEYTEKIQIELKVAVKSGARTLPMEQKQVMVGEIYNLRNILYSNLDVNSLEKIFDNLLNTDLSGVEQVVKDKIVAQSSEILKKSFDVWIKQIRENIQSNIELKNNKNNDVVDFDDSDFKEKMTILFFYLYGLKKLNHNLENFSNKDIFLKSVIESDNNKFLGDTFGAYKTQYGPEGGSVGVFTPFFYKVASTNEYLTFVNGGEKISSVPVGLFWFGIISIVLMGTILIYYRKDFV